MDRLREPNDLTTAGRPVCLAIGVFDGVHLGHQRVLEHALHQAQRLNGLAVAVTFDRHPQSVLAPESAPGAIFPLPHKLRLLESFGLDAAWVIAFDRPFSRQPAETFIQRLTDGFHPLRSISVGDTFVFGRDRSGDVPLLARAGPSLGFEVHGLNAVRFDGDVISSTRIREAIAGGQLTHAGQLLGRPYSLSGRVIPGQQLGRRLGFPTANLDTTGLLLPPNGVYAGLVHHLPDHPSPHPAVLNIGIRPTVSSGDTQRHAEVHLLDFDADLYDQDLEFQPVSVLRGEQRFASLEDLQAQIRHDLTEARRRLIPAASR